MAALFLAGWTLRLASANTPSSFLDLANLAFHEAGHVFLLPFGRTLHLLGGTLVQLLVPALLAASFLHRRRPFSASVCGWWLGQNLVNVSVYMADARVLRLPLVGGGEHDWNELFFRFGLLGEDAVARISTATHHLGIAVMLAAAAWAAIPSLPVRIRETLREGLSRRVPFAAVLFETSVEPPVQRLTRESPLPGSVPAGSRPLR